MKHFIIQFLMLCLYVTVFSQEAALGLNKQNILYIGVDNPASFSVEGVKCKDVKVLINGELIQTYGSHFFINPKNEGEGEVRVALIPKNSRKVFLFPFRAKRLPPPNFYLNVGSIYEGIKNPILYADGLKGIYNNIEYDIGELNIDSFTIDIVNKKANKVLQYNITSSSFTKEVKAELQLLQSGDFVVIDKVHIKSKINSYVLAPVVYRVE